MNEKANTNFCSNCGEKIEDKNVKFCSNCGSELEKPKEKIIEEKPILNNEDKPEEKTISKTNKIYTKNPALAAILTFFLSCLGQFYNGQILKGILFVLILMVLIYVNFILALLFIIYATYDAYKNAKYINENNGNYFYNEAI